VLKPVLGVYAEPNEHQHDGHLDQHAHDRCRGRPEDNPNSIVEVAMSYSGSTIALFGLFAVLTLFCAANRFVPKQFALGSYLSYTWIFLLSFTATEAIAFDVGVWILAFVCFRALREYFSLVDIRLQDRLGILGAYLSIPFMIYFIQIDWYGMFIIAIPVYAFLAIPLLVTLGGKEAKGTVFSVGVIDFGLFLFVYCLGHIGYLMRFSTWAAVFLILSVTVCDGFARAIQSRSSIARVDLLARYFLPLPVVAMLAWLLSPWTEIPLPHAFILAAMIPLLVILGQHTIGYVKRDLGVSESPSTPGQGKILDNLRSLFFTAPLVFHYFRYFLT
jgi:phosphatidate cytidylyltransferase